MEISDIDAKEIDYIDYKLDYVRFSKDFFNLKKQKSRKATNSSKGLNDLMGVFRERDLKMALKKYSNCDEWEEWMREILAQKLKYLNLNDEQYKAMYQLKFKNVKEI